MSMSFCHNFIFGIYIVMFRNKNKNKNKKLWQKNKKQLLE